MGNSGGFREVFGDGEGGLRRMRGTWGREAWRRRIAWRSGGALTTAMVSEGSLAVLVLRGSASVRRGGGFHGSKNHGLGKDVDGARAQRHQIVEGGVLRGAGYCSASPVW